LQSNDVLLFGILDVLFLGLVENAHVAALLFFLSLGLGVELLLSWRFEVHAEVVEMLVRVVVGSFLLVADEVVRPPVLRGVDGFVLVLGGAGFDAEGRFLPLLGDADIPDVEVDDGALLRVRPEELVLGFRFGALEGLDGRVVEVRRADIGVAGVPAPQMLFEQQVVGGGDVVVFVGFDASRAVIEIEVELR
jgi:uncharacterized membrane protein YedE/YeeE